MMYPYTYINQSRTVVVSVPATVVVDKFVTASPPVPCHGNSTFTGFQPVETISVAGNSTSLIFPTSTTSTFTTSTTVATSSTHCTSAGNGYGSVVSTSTSFTSSTTSFTSEITSITSVTPSIVTVGVSSTVVVVVTSAPQ